MTRSQNELRQRNPIRGTMHLPQDVANLDEIDWSPLPEPAHKPGFPPECAPETGMHVPEAQR